MLVLCSKILVILVVTQYVTSVEFNKNKRDPLTYKEIRRTYSFKSKEENVVSKPAEMFFEKDLDQDAFTGNVEITDIKQPNLTTINNNKEIINVPLKKNVGNVKIEYIEADSNEKSDQDKESIDNMENTKEEAILTTTIKSKRRPFHLRKISKSSETSINESNDRDKLLIGRVQTSDRKQFSSTTATAAVKRLNYNIRTFRNKGVTVQIKPVEVFAKEDIDEVKEPVDDIQITKENKPLVTATTIKTDRRFSNLRLLKNKSEKIQSTSAKTIVSVNADLDKVSNGNLQTSKKDTPILTTSEMKSLTRTLNSALNRKEGGINSKLVSSGNEETTENKKIFVRTSVVKPLIPAALSLSNTLKKEEKDGESESIQPIINERADREIISDDDIQIIKYKKPSVVPSTIKSKSLTSNPYSLKREEVNTNGLISSANVQNPEGKNVVITSSTVKAKTSPILSLRSTLKMKEAEGDSKSIRTIINGDSKKDKVSNVNIEIIGGKKYTVITNAPKPKTSTLNTYSLSPKGQDKNSDVDFMEKLLIENAKPEEMAIDNTQNRNKKISVSTGSVKLHLKRKEDNSDSEYAEKIVNENISQIKVSDSLGNLKLRTSSVKLNTSASSSYSAKEETDIETTVKENAGQARVSLGTVKISGDDKLSTITSTVNPQTSILNVHSSNKETSGESIKTLVNNGISQTKVSIGNAKVTGVSTRTITPRRRTLNLYSLKTKENNFDSKPVETLVNEKFDQDEVVISNKQTTGDKKLRVTSSVMNPQRRTLNTISLKKKEENTSSQTIEALVSEKIFQEKASTEDVQNTGDIKFSHVPRTIKPQRRTSNSNSLEKKENNASSQPIGILVSENASIGDVQSTGDIKFSHVSRTIKPQRRTSNSNSLEKKENNASSQPIGILVSENASIRDVQSAGDIKFSLTSRTIKPQRRTSNPNSSREKEQNTSSQSIARLDSENIQQEKASTADVLIAENKKFTLFSSSVAPQRRTSNFNSLKKKEENTSSQSIERLDSENIQKDQTSTADILNAENKKFSLISGILTPLRGTSNLNSSKKKEVNISGKHDEMLFENMHQDKASTEDEQNAEDKNFSFISSTIKSQKPTLNIDSLKTTEGNPNSESVATVISKNFDDKEIAIDNIHSEHATTEATSPISTEEPKILTANSAIFGHGNNRIIKTQRKIIVQNSRLDAESNPSSINTLYNKDHYVVSTQAPRSDGKYYQTSTLHTQLEKTTKKSENFVPIVGVQNYVYAYSGDYHYSYEGGDGTKAFERGELKSADGSSSSSGVVGGYSYKDKDGNDFNLSYTAGEGGYQPVGAHLPTSPPIPPAIQRVLRILATKTTPEPVTERIKSDYRN